MQTAPQYDITIRSNVQFVLPLTYRNPNNSDGSLGNPINLTGYSARMQIRPTARSQEVLVDLNSSGSGIVLGGSAGTITITITSIQIATFYFTNAAYDLVLTDPSGNPICILQGNVIYAQGVTR